MRFASTIFVCLVVLLCQSADGSAETRFLGLGGFGTNDRLGDEQDRWRTGSYEVTAAFGKRWSGVLPEAPSAILGMRVRGEIISPHPITATGPGQRLYAGVLGVGLQGYTRLGETEVMAGADLVLLGPQTRLHTVQEFLHELSGGGMPPEPDEQLDDALVPTAYVELGQSFGGIARIRPFVEAQVGYETFARVGVDATLGNFGREALMTRDVLSGERYPVISGPARKGFSVTAGADVALIADSRLFPSNNGPEERRFRPRARAGLSYDAGPAWAFFGLTWLGREFEGGSEGQRVGTVTFGVRF